jgi:hypothetical protein
MLSRTVQIMCWALCGAMTVSGAVAAEPTAMCKGNPTIVDKCTLVHGRAVLRGDGLFTLTPVDPKRLMTIKPGISLPANMDAILRHDWRTVIMGDFEVCPLTKYQPGQRQDICIETASRLVSQSRAQAGSVAPP